MFKRTEIPADHKALRVSLGHAGQGCPGRVRVDEWATLGEVHLSTPHLCDTFPDRES